MNAILIMETVHTCVSIRLVPMNVGAEVDIHCPAIEEAAMISMSVTQTTEGVSTRVSTLLVLTSVSVEVDSHSPAIGEPALI